MEEITYTTINTQILTTNLKTNKTSYITFAIPLYLFTLTSTTSEKLQNFINYIHKHYLFENIKNYKFHSYKIPETNWYN